MRSIKMKGQNADAAVDAALKVLGAKKEDVETTIISEGKSAILGVFGGEEAEVEVKVKVSLEEEARERVQNIMDRTGFMTLVNVSGQEEDAIFLEIKGEDLGRIIGREGATLEALSYLTSVILSKEHSRRIRVVVDAAGYRGRQERRLQRMAEEAAVEAASSGKEVTLPPMSAAERRIIHLAVAENPKVSSFSRGEKDLRQVIVAPKEQGESEPTNQ